MPEQTPEHSESVKRLMIEERTVRTALGLHEAELRRIEHRYAGEISAALRPTIAGLAQKVSDGLDLARDAGKESEMLRTAANIEAGTDVIPAVQFPFLQPDFGDSGDIVRQFQRRLRIEGYLV